MRLIDFLSSDLVIPELRGIDVESVVSEMAAAAQGAGLAAAPLVRERLLERERLHSTVMGSGLAIPHATVPGLERTVVGVARVAGEPIAFGPREHGLVSVLFLVLSPPGMEREHVRLLARVCRMVRNEGFVDALASAPDAPRIVKLITATDALHP